MLLRRAAADTIESGGYQSQAFNTKPFDSFMQTKNGSRKRSKSRGHLDMKKFTPSINLELGQQFATDVDQDHDGQMIEYFAQKFARKNERQMKSRSMSGKRKSE